MGKRLISMVVLTALLLGIAQATPALAETNGISHAGTGKPIDILNVGESYAATTGGGSYALSTYDDKETASPFPGAGVGCYRSWNTAAYQAYNMLGSKGLFINRACHGALLGHTMPEVANLSVSTKDQIDLINFSNGGNDGNGNNVGNLKEIAICISTPWRSNELKNIPGYGEVSAECANHIDTLSAMTTIDGTDGFSKLVRGQSQQIDSLLAEFKNAKLILQGYPLLIDETPSAKMVTWWNSQFASNSSAQGKRTWKYVANVLNQILLTVESQQKRLVSRNEGRIGYNNLYFTFGEWEKNQAVGSGKPWLYEPLKLPIVFESYHPNATGIKAIADGLVAEVNRKGWFSLFPSQTKPNDQYYYYPGANGGTSHYLSSSDGSMVKTTGVGGLSNTSFLDSCKAGQSQTMDGRSPRPGHPELQIYPGAQDRITINCMKVQVGDILTIPKTGTLQDTDPSYYAKSVSSNGVVEWLHITAGWMFNCLKAQPNAIRFYGNESLTVGTVDMPGRAGCVPQDWLKKVLSAPDKTSHFIDEWGWRHEIPNTETFYALTDKYGAAIVIARQVDVDTIPVGDPHPLLLRIKDYEGKMICRTDGICWVVINGERGHVPDLPTEICAKYVHNRVVARKDLTFELANTIPEGTWKYSCNLENSILRAVDKPDPKPSYAFYGGKIYWNTDGWTWDFLVQRGFRVVDVATEAEIKLLPYGGTEIRLDEAGIPNNSILCTNTNICYVMRDGFVHRIPDPQSDVCWRWLNGYKVTASNLSSLHITTVFPEKEAWSCVINNYLVKGDNGQSWVFLNNVRREVPDGESFWEYAKIYPVVGPWPAGEINKFQLGSRMPYKINPDSVKNSIICRSDGVCWAVDGNGRRHHIPTYADNVCWRWVNGWKVSRSGLNYEQAASLPEDGAWGCSMDAKIVYTNEGAIYRMWGNQRRWITDMESVYCYRDQSTGLGYSGDIRGIGMEEVRPIPEGNWMPRCLSKHRVKGKIVREGGGTAYWVDWSGYWHWIPNGDVWYCLRSRYSVLIWDATWEQINSIKVEGAHANCNM